MLRLPLTGGWLRSTVLLLRAGTEETAEQPATCLCCVVPWADWLRHTTGKLLVWPKMGIIVGQLW